MSTKLKGTRSGHRSALTRLLRRFDDVTSKEEFDRDEVSTILDLIIDKQRFVSDLNNQIISELLEEELEAEISDSDEYSITLETKIRKMRKCLEPTARSYSLPVTDSSLNPLAQSFDVNRNQTASFNSQLMYAPHMSNSNNQFHKLPKLELSKFDGNILNWQAFWESYDTAIHSNPSLTDAQKFNYLKTLLQNEALTTVSGFTLTNLNYSKAIDLLHQRFGQTQKITHTYMQTLLALPAPESTVQSCRRFYDKSETLIRGLESLGQSQESYGALLIPIMLNKLPSRIKENITREHGLKQWSLDELRQHLFNEISILEAGQRVNLELDETLHSSVYLAKTDTKNNYNNNNNNRKPQRSEVAVHTRKPCIYCGESHSPNTCMKIVDQKARLEILKQKKACFNCLGNHRVTDCKSKGTCKQCGRKYFSRPR